MHHCTIARRAAAGVARRAAPSSIETCPSRSHSSSAASFEATPGQTLVTGARWALATDVASTQVRTALFLPLLESSTNDLAGKRIKRLPLPHGVNGMWPTDKSLNRDGAAEH